ncbi:hypothetical protein [Kineobactrum sediminis]|uniref:hypothetical protein n=1 Tax=Kineobactrum sediminis TaxID=1905677 RepID=UPI00158DC963|nr:hypothetical protein [Kineobactrum sediminis]
MAEETNTATATETSAAAPAETTTASKAAPKPKTAARKSTASKTTASKSTPRKTATAKAPGGKASAVKTTRKKAAPRKATAKRGRRKATPDLAARAQEAGRNAFLASLGFYGKAFDQVQEQFTNLQGQLESRRKVANKTYADLVKRGTRVEKDAKGLIRDIELPRLELESLTDRKKLEARLGQARARFNELKSSVGLKSAA